MFWALLAKVLLRQPAWVQAVTLGLCTGMFITATADANQRDPSLDSTAVMVLSWGTAAAGFYMGFRVQNRHEALADHTAPRWLYALYAVIWLLGIAAAVIALVGEGGVKVAVLAIVPLVLLAPTALYGLRQVTHRMPA
jgi:hypothetical protein